MSKILQLKRGNTSISNSYTGSPGEVTVDTTNWDLRVHDGVTAGGWIVDSSNSGGSFGNVTVSGDLTANNIIATNDIDASGNITANYFIGNGSQLTGLPQGYTDSDVIALLGNLSGNIIPSANATYNLGNVSNQWKELWVSNNTIYIGGVPIGISGNTLVVNGEPVLTNDSSDSITTTGNITSGNLSVTGQATLDDLSIVGSDITLSPGSSATYVGISPDGESQAFLQIPNNDTANTANVRLVNNDGNVTIETNAGNIWTFGYGGDLTAPGNVSANAILTDNYFYANGAPFSSGGSIGNLEVTGTTIGISAVAGESTITVGNASAGLSVTPNGELPVSKLYAYSTDQAYFSQGDADYSSGTYTTGQITLSGATNVIDFLNALQGQLVSVTVNGTDTVAISSYGYGGGTVTLYTSTPPSVDPTTVTEIEFNTQFENRIVFDTDNGDYGIYIADHNFDIESVRDVRITSGDDFSIESEDGFDLRSRSTTGGIDLITDYGNSQQTWRFRYDGTLTTPGDITVSGHITGTSSASTLVLAAEPNSNTAIQLNDSVDSIIRTVANLEISTDVSNTSKTWTFDTSGDLTVPNYIYFKDGTFMGDEGGAGTPVFRIDSPVGLGINLTTESDISGNNYTWSFGIDGNLTAPGNITTTGNITGDNLISFATIYSNVDIVVGNIVDASSTKTRITTFGANSYIQTGNGTVGSTGNIVFAPYLDSTEKVVIDTASGNVTVTGNLFATGTDGNVVTRFESTWTVPTGNSTQSFTVDANNTYYMWVEGNIPNGIIVWNATATVTNTNVPVVGAQYAWVYDGGGTPIDFTSLPNQFIGTANTIVRSSVAPSATTNRFDFGINNTSGSEQTVRYGWIRIS